VGSCHIDLEFRGDPAAAIFWPDPASGRWTVSLPRLIDSLSKAVEDGGRRPSKTADGFPPKLVGDADDVEDLDVLVGGLGLLATATVNELALPGFRRGSRPWHCPSSCLDQLKDLMSCERSAGW
jgi:hypothetical protein